MDVRDNAPIDPEWFDGVASPGWQQRWLDNFAMNQAGGGAAVDLVQDGWTDLGRRIRQAISALPREQRTVPNMLAAYEHADFQKMEEIRARAEALVHDKATADRLKAWYRQLCKRPCFHDHYLQAFSRPNVRLVDTDGRGVERITGDWVVVAGKAYPVDCIIYASGFEVGTPFVRRAGFDMVGRGGRLLSDHWHDGMRSLHGIYANGFPNTFFVQPTQGANLIWNVPHYLSESARTIAAVVRHAREKGVAEVEVTAEAEQAWVDLMLTGVGRMTQSPDCTPGYYNNEGRDAGIAARLQVGYPAGPPAYFKYLDGWRQSGGFDGLKLG